MSKLKKYVEENKSSKSPDLEIIDRGISNLSEYPQLFELAHITKLNLVHNKLTEIPAAITNLYNLETLNVFNNHIKELPQTISQLVKLKVLNAGMNKLNTLPRGFGALPVLMDLDLTYNNLTENSLPANFYQLDSLRALYLGDNDFEMIHPEIGKLKNLQILVFRDNDLVSIPKEIGDLTRLRELHIQGNRLTVLPPEIGNLDLVGSRQIFRGENNPWVTPIADQYQVGVSHVFEYIRSETYKFLYGRHIAADAAPPPKTRDKSKKVSRVG